MKRTDDQILQSYFKNGRLTVIPAKRNKKLIVLRWLSERFEIGRTYTEAEVNAIIKAFHPDFATLRRELYDNFLLERSNSQYWRSTADETPGVKPTSSE